jgi:plastocyanin
MSMRQVTAVVALGVAVMGPREARAEDAGETARLRAEVARLQQEVRELRQLVVQAVQNDQQHFEMLLKLIQSGGGSAALPPGSTPRSAPSPGTLPGQSPEPGAALTPAPAAVVTGTISGKVRAEGTDLGEAYVYVEGYKSSPVRNRTIEIRQKDKRFVPSVAVVQVGTRVVFPNLDTVIHNVFSTTPDNVFDLGTVKAGDQTTPVAMLKPGHIEVYCNIHSKMRADLLVVQNPFWSKVASDGTFQISGVPAGQRKVVLWGPTLTPVSQRVDITPHGATVTINAAAAAVRPHLNKHGQPYGSYAE